MQNTIYISGISYSLKEVDLKKIFSLSGEVVSVRIITDPETGRKKDFCFVEYVDEREAKKAVLEFNNKIIRGRKISVSIALPKKEGTNKPKRIVSIHPKKRFQEIKNTPVVKKQIQEEKIEEKEDKPLPINRKFYFVNGENNEV